MTTVRDQSLNQFVVSLLVVIVLCASCKTRQTNLDSTAKSVVNPAPQNYDGSDLIVVSGGRGSCSLVRYPAEANLWRQLLGILPADRQLTVVRTCFGFETGQVVNYDIVLVNSGVVSSQKLFPWKSGNRDDLLKDLTPFLAVAKKITMVGQSYGGFTVHYLAHRMPTDRQVITSLFTVDPISPYECTVTKFAVYSDKCKNFPVDMLVLSIQKNFEGRWVNFYQTNFTPLHSGACSVADQNIQLTYPDPDFAVMGAHQLTESDQRVWKLVKERL